MREQDYPQGAGEPTTHRGGFLGFWDREGTRVLLGAIAVLGGMAWNGLKDDVAGVKTSQDRQTLTAMEIKSDVRNITTRLDEGVIRDVTQNREDIKELKRRVEQVESATRIP